MYFDIPELKTKHFRFEFMKRKRLNKMMRVEIYKKYPKYRIHIYNDIISINNNRLSND